MEPLPEFKVTLTRVKKGKTAIPVGDDVEGQRTKLGGVPDWEQEEDVPICDSCRKKMSFVAQIDSVEHDWDTNPHSVDACSDRQKWMFGDVGLIYVFFCFPCLHTKSVFQCG
jgi:hypothetical protein